MFKTNTFRTFIVLLLMSGAAFAQFATISGTVTNNGNPVANTTLWFSADDTTQGNFGVKAVETDQDGNFSQNWFPTPTTITQQDTFSYSPVTIHVTDFEQFPTPTIVDIVFETRKQDATFSGNVSFENAGYQSDIFMLKLPADVDPADFTEVESHFMAPQVPTRWASYSFASDANGDFSVDVLFGNYVVYVPGNGDLLPSWTVVTIDDDFSGYQIEMRKKVHISGAVANTDGYDYVTISGYSVNSGRPFKADVFNGEYDIEVAPGDYVLHLRAFFMIDDSSYIYTEFYDGVHSRDEATVVKAETDVSGIDFTLPNPEVFPYTVSGTVTDENGSAVSGANVTIISTNIVSNLMMTYDATTDDKGSYSITGYTMLDEDSLVAFAWADGYFSEFYENQATFLTADPVVYHPNETVTVNFELNTIDTTSGYGISGSVTDTAGNVIGFGQVTAYSTYPENFQTYVTIDENGNYEFPAIFPTGSTVFLQCWVGFEYLPQIYDGVDSWEDATPITIGADNITGADFSLTPKPARRATIGSIIGTVNPGGLAKTTGVNVYEGSMVYIKQQGTDSWQEVDYVDENGSFKLGVEGYGSYDLLLTSPERTDQELTGVVVDERTGLVKDDVSITLGVTAIGDLNDANTITTNKLYSAYPNPFNPATTIQVELANTEIAELTVYNVAGQKVKTLHTGLLQSGTSKFVWNGNNNSGTVVSSGIYFIQLRTQKGLQTKSVIFLK